MAKTAICLFDIHWPKTDKATLEAVFDFLSKNKVDMVYLGGDQFDNECISHHTKGKPLLREKGAYREDEITFEQNFLTPLEKLVGKADKIWQIGNHDHWEHQLIESQPELLGVLERENSLSLRKRGWQVVPCGAGYKLGKLLLIHGETLSGIGNQAGAMHARKAVDVYAGNVLYGHMHSPQSFAKVLPFDAKEKWMAYCSPVLGSTNPGYLRNRPTAWLNGMTIVEYRDNGNFNVYPIIISEGTFSYGGKDYGKIKRPTAVRRAK